MIELFEELTAPPIVGRFYLVLCVFGRWYDKVSWWPVWGPKHEDEKFLNFPQRHYHLNRFFIRDDQVERAESGPLGEMTGFRGYKDNDPLQPPILKRKLCRRVVAPFPLHRAKGDIWQRMYRHYAGQQCQQSGTGWVCPHKGMRLGAIPADADGYITCPLHGLRIHHESGVVAR